jgi:hypothetical protein
MSLGPDAKLSITQRGNLRRAWPQAEAQPAGNPVPVGPSVGSMVKAKGEAMAIGLAADAVNANEPSWVATPMSVPFICRTATTQAAAASPSVAVNAACCRNCTVSRPLFTT